MKKDVMMTIDEDLIKLAKSYGLNVSGCVETLLGLYLTSTPKKTIHRYVANQSKYDAIAQQKMQKHLKLILRGIEGVIKEVAAGVKD